MRKVSGLLALAFAGVAGVSAYAFTASNTVPDQSAGAGNATVSGYVVSSPTNYTFSANGADVTSVSFDLDHAASDVAVALSNATPVHANWVDCGASGSSSPYAVTCDLTDGGATSGVAVAAGNELSVAAVSTGTVTIGP
jgi:hypothetical protein